MKLTIISTTFISFVRVLTFIYFLLFSSHDFALREKTIEPMKWWLWRSLRVEVPIPINWLQILCSYQFSIIVSIRNFPDFEIEIDLSFELVNKHISALFSDPKNSRKYIYILYIYIFLIYIFFNIYFFNIFFDFNF